MYQTSDLPLIEIGKRFRLSSEAITKERKKREIPERPNPRAYRF